MSEPNRPARPGAVIFAALFVAGAAVLLFHMGEQTRFSSRGQLVAQPRFWPAVGVFGMLLFGLGHLWHSWRARSPGAGPEAVIWLRSLEYLGWFMAYVWLVPRLGYLPTTLIFTTLLAFRLGYRGARQLGLAGFLGLVIVLVFKTGLSVRIPGGAVYDALPETLRNLMIVYF